MNKEKMVLTHSQVKAIMEEMEILKEQIKEVNKYFGNSKIGGGGNGGSYLSENNNLTERLYTLKAKLNYWKEILNDSTTEITKKPEDVIQIGSVVKLHEIYDNKDVTIQILGTVTGIEKTQNEIVTANSKFGKVLLNKERKKGDIIPFVFDIENPCKYEVKEVIWNDQLYTTKQEEMPKQKVLKR